MQLPIQGWTLVTSFGIVGGMSALLTPIREAAVARVVNLLRSASNSLLIGSGIAGVTVGVGCLVYVGKCSSLMQDISKYEDASRRWRGLFEETTRVMNLPNQNSQLSFKDFDLEVSTLLSLKKELDKLPKTVNEDYEYARKVLNRDFEQQDWTWWETLYPPPRG